MSNNPGRHGTQSNVSPRSVLYFARLCFVLFNFVHIFFRSPAMLERFAWISYKTIWKTFHSLEYMLISQSSGPWAWLGCVGEKPTHKEPKIVRPDNSSLFHINQKLTEKNENGNIKQNGRKFGAKLKKNIFPTPLCWLRQLNRVLPVLLSSLHPSSDSSHLVN